LAADPPHVLDRAPKAKAPAVAVPTGAHTAAQLATRPHLAILNDLSELPGFIARL